MRAGRFQQASDIYALSLVLWEIRTTLFPFQHCKNFQTLIQEAVLSGYRHEFPSIPKDSIDREVLEEFENLIREAWREVPSERPDINQIIVRLEDMLLSTCYVSLKMNTKNLLENGTPFSAYPHVTTNVRLSSRQSSSRESFGGIQSFLARPLRETFSKVNSVLVSDMPIKLRSKSFWAHFNRHGGAWAVVPLDNSSFPIWFRTIAWNNMMAKHSPSMTENSSAPIRIADILLEAGYYIPRVGNAEALETTLQSEFPQQFFNFLNSIRKYHYGHLLVSNEELVPSGLGYNNATKTHSELSIHAYQVNITVDDSSDQEYTDLSSALDKSEDRTLSSQPISFATILFQELMTKRNVSQRVSVDHNPTSILSADLEDRSDKTSFVSVPLNMNSKFSGTVQPTTV